MTGPVRTYAVAAVLAVLAGAGVAYCQHQGDDPAPVDCSNVAFAVPAVTKTKSSTDKRSDTPPRREVRKDPRPVTSPSSSPPARRRNHIDLDLDMDGC